MLRGCWLFLCLPLWVASLALPSPGQARAKAVPPPAEVKLLILPGFGNDEVDYELPQAPEGSLCMSLQSRGWKAEQISILPVKRSDWLQVFYKGGLDPAFWLGKAPPTGPAFSWYLDRIKASVLEMCQDDEETAVILVAHSAGGWLARASLGICQAAAVENEVAMDKTTGSEVTVDLKEIDVFGRIAGLVTLGSPHIPPPVEVMDMTRGALRWTETFYPGAYHVDNLFYLTVIGEAIRGVQQDRQSPRNAGSFAYDSYRGVCGDGATTGDGVVPLCAGHLEGATQLTLPGVLHSINAPAAWYGSEPVIDQWHDPMLKELQKWRRQRFRERSQKYLKSAVRGLIP